MYRNAECMPVRGVGSKGTSLPRERSAVSPGVISVYRHGEENYAAFFGANFVTHKSEREEPSNISSTATQGENGT
ncbi:hypothetical protein N7513_003187 [Penicillium frequentans]|nr:hypothetical protein N7513_003187 [Penicillium glabrum]